MTHGGNTPMASSTPMLRLWSVLAPVRVTATYALALGFVEVTLVQLGPHVQDRVIDHLSTNLHNLTHGHLGTLIGSAFVTGDDRVYAWLPGLVCLLAVGELLWSGKRLVVAFTLGHVGATLIIAVGLATAVLSGWLPASIADASDVGISYGAAAVVGTLTAAVPVRWRLAWVCFWLANALAVAVPVDGYDFSASGHVVALALGMVLATRFRSPAQWTLPRLILLAGGVVFGYVALIGFSTGTPAAGIAAASIAVVARSAGYRWNTRDRSHSVAPQEYAHAFAD
jgi:hypothetical protein